MAIAFASLAGGGAPAAMQGRYPIPFEIDFDDFDAFVEHMSLTDDESARCLAAYQEYRKRVIALKKAAFERLQRIDLRRLRTLRRELMPADEEALLFPDANRDPKANWAPPDDPRWRELRELEAARHNHGVEERGRSIGLLENLLVRLQAILDERVGHPETAAMFILSRFSDRNGSGRGNEYLFLSVDIRALVRDSRTEGILGHIEKRAHRGKLDRDAFIDLTVAIDGAVADYAQAYEQYLRRRLLRRGSRRTPDEIVFSRIVDESHEPRMRESGRAWLARHELDRRAVDAIAALLRDALDDDAARAWIDEYRSRVAHDLFADRWPHEMVEWLSERADAIPVQLEAARMLQAQFVQQYAAARDREYALGVQACTASGLTMVPLPTDPGPHERYFESVARMHLVSLDAVLSFRAILTDAQRRDIIPVWKRGMPPYWGGGVFGPSVMTQWVSDDLDTRLEEMRKRLVEN